MSIDYSINLNYYQANDDVTHDLFYINASIVSSSEGRSFDSTVRGCEKLLLKLSLKYYL